MGYHEEKKKALATKERHERKIITPNIHRACDLRDAPFPSP
jgi:hypothetical protein